jgi:predicted MFS family arabinose efflux permease
VRQDEAVRRLLFLCCAIVAVDTMFYAAITPLLPAYVDEFSLSKGEAGVLAGAYAAGTLLGALPGGLLAARVGVKRTVLFGLGGMAAASVAFAFAPSIEVLVGARFVQGWAGAATWAGALAWLVGAAPASRRGEMIGTALGAAIAGALLGPVLGGAAQWLGDEPTFSAVGVLAVVLGAWAWVTPAAVPAGAGRLRDVWGALRDGRVAGGMWLMVMPGLLFGTIGVLVPLRLDDLGASAGLIATVWLVAAGLEAIVSPIVGRLSDRHGRLAPAAVAMAGSIAVVLLLPVPDTVALLVAVMLVAAPVIGIIWAPASALLSDGAEGVGLDQGLGFALMNLAWAGGQTLGSAGGGRLAEATSDAVAYGVLAAICAATLAVVLTRRQAGAVEIGHG